MAKICEPKFSEGPVNGGEERLLNFLEARLPDSYYVVPNGNYPSKNPQGAVQYWEYDAIVVAPHAIYHIENKDYRGRLEAYDDAWFHNDKEIPNPLKTATFKSKIVASYLKAKNPLFGKAWVETIVVLSSLGQTKSGFDPESACYEKTFLLDNTLIDYIEDNERLSKSANAIANLQWDIVDHLVGSSQPRKYIKKNVAGMIIDDTLNTTSDYIEYLCHKQFPADKKWKVRDYALDKAGLSPMQLERYNKLVKNGEISQAYLPDNSGVILKSECREDDNHYLVITPYLDDKSLKCEIKRNTFTDVDKIRILLDISEALSIAHENNVIHRSVSPENIYIQNDRHAALANFGLAYNDAHADENYNETIDVDSFGIDPYTSEDVHIGDSSPASDVYSFGVIAYELMVGKIPFENYLKLYQMGGKLPDSLVPSKVNKNVEPWVDELCQRTIVLDSSERWANIDEIRQFIYEKGLMTKFTNSNQPVATTALNDLKPTDMITNDITLGEMLGEGGFSRVFKAKNNMMPGSELAAKIFKEGISPRAAIDEFKALANLQHDNIVKFIFNGTTNGGLFFTLMSYVNGQDIRQYTMGDMFLPLPIIYQFLQEMLSALIYMQKQQPPVIHRDIKPENIIYSKEGKFVLIDFNIATANEKDKHKVGTWPYLAPDLETGNKMLWDTSADTFALGVTLFELVSHVYPWPGKQRTPVLGQKPIDVSQQNSQISPSFAAFIMKACETRRSNRFADAQSMLDALNEIGESGIIKLQSVSHYNVDNKELHIVDYINSLYSQSIRGNAGTRAGWKEDHFLDEETYTKTKLDTKLLSAIQSGKYKLVIITGNAGDGKTAFIKRVEKLGDNIYNCTSHNGALFNIGGVKYESNYDGSQDENNIKNIDVLRNFFNPFVGLTDFNQSKEGRIIAINEGRLIDFLEASPEHKFLYNAIDEYFYKEGTTPLPEGVMVINLNLRSVTAIDEKGESLFSKQVKALTSKSLWSKCETCPLGDKCFIKYNVDSLSDSAVGCSIIRRLEWIVRTIVYKREVHITMRDIRSMIAWLITRDYSCDDIPNLIAKEVSLRQDLENASSDDEREQAKLRLDYYTQESWLRYYFNVTSPDSNLFPDLRSEDRIVKLLQETDIASVSIPDRDRDLYYKHQSETEYLAFAERKQSLLKAFNDTCDIRPSYLQKAEEVRLLKMRHKALIRHQYYEGKADFMDRMPYHSIGRFYDELNASDEKREAVKKWLSYAISCSEGCWNTELSKDHLLLSSSRIADPSGKSYRRFPLKDFELTVDTNDKLTEYLEHENDSFIFRSKEKKHIQLNVSLDLYEMLYYISNGFSPSVSDLKGRFIELQVFKNLLESETYTEVIVTNNEKDYYRISLDKSNMKLYVEPFKNQEL